MDTEHSSTVPRRTQILEAAFALMRTARPWSLSDVANRVGISKPAIYRHFKNRAELEERMNESLDRDLAAAIVAAGADRKRIRTALFEFFTANPGYLALFFHNLYSDPSYHTQIFARLASSIPALGDFSRWLDRNRGPVADRALLGLLKNAVTILFGSVSIPGMLQNREQMESLLGNGFPELEIPGPERLDELERLCRLESAELPPEHRLFSAIAASIREHGIHNTTIERIAEKMGTAKSSLYFYFPNKREMFAELIRNQSSAIRALCADRVRELNSLAEQIFAVLAVQANYLALRPDVIPVFGWIHYEAVREQMECITPEIETLNDTEPFRIEDLAPGPEQKERLDKLIRWTSAMSTTTVIYSNKHGTSAEDARKNIRLMFLEMMNGDKE